MRFYSKFRLKLYHFLIRWLGDKELEKEGTKRIPCLKCGNFFRSYQHYGGWGYTYDAYCKDCDPVDYGGVTSNYFGETKNVTTQ